MPSHRNVARAQRRGQGELESEILAELWAQGRPVTATEILESLGGDLAYNTVQTVLVRLLDKGLVERDKAGRAHLYRAAHDEPSLTAERMAAQLAPSTDHSAVLAQFVATLAPVDAHALREILDRKSDPPRRQR